VNGYPLVLVDLARSLCVVVGGGEIAARKVAGLCQAGARPLVISPQLCDALRRRIADGEVNVLERTYQPGDLAGARLVIAATDDPAVNALVWHEAQAAGCLVNVVDDPGYCNFHVPAVVRRGDLVLSISTGGNSPALARYMREGLEQQFDAAYEPYLALLGELRPLVQQRVANPASRQALWTSLLKSDILEMLRSGAVQQARQRAQEIIDTFC
jgi:precorrin-2 dehydrogenase/sirohydrochlorin ferrochelatase